MQHRSAIVPVLLLLASACGVQTAGASNPTIRNYEAEMKSLIDYYADRCANIDANQTPVLVTYDILRVILDHPEQTQLGGEG